MNRAVLTDLNNPLFHETDRKAFEKQRKKLLDSVSNSENPDMVPTKSPKGLKYLDPKQVPNSGIFDTGGLNAIQKVKKIYKSANYSESGSVMKSNQGSNYDASDKEEDNKKKSETLRNGSRRTSVNNNKPEFNKLSRTDKIRLLEKEKAEIERKIQLLEQRRKQRITLNGSSFTHQEKKKPQKPTDSGILTSLHARAQGMVKAPSQSYLKEDEGIRMPKGPGRTGRKSKNKDLEEIQNNLHNQRNAKSLGVFVPAKREHLPPSENESEVEEKREKKREKSRKSKSRKTLKELSSKEIVEDERSYLEAKEKKKRKKSKSKSKKPKKPERIGEEEGDGINMNAIKFSDDEPEKSEKKKKKRKKKKSSRPSKEKEFEKEEVSKPSVEYKSSIGEKIRKQKERKKSSKPKLFEEREESNVDSNKEKLLELKRKLDQKKLLQNEMSRDEGRDQDVKEIFSKDDDNSWDEFN